MYSTLFSNKYKKLQNVLKLKYKVKHCIFWLTNSIDGGAGGDGLNIAVMLAIWHGLI